GNTLDSRSISAFSSGGWVVWNLSGHVTLRLTTTAGPNAAVSGIFFSPPAAPDFSVSATPSKQNVLQGSSTPYTVNVSSVAGFTGTVNLSASGLPTGATATFNPASISNSGASTLIVSTTPATPGGAYNLTVTGANGSLSHSAQATLAVNVVVPAAA